jgi:hypothetical protein
VTKDIEENQKYAEMGKQENKSAVRDLVESGAVRLMG